MRAEAEAMARMAGSLTEEQMLPRFVEQVRTTFSVRSAAVLRQDGEGWHVESSAGDPVPREPSAADVRKPLGADRVLALAGRQLATEDHKLLDALTAQAALVMEARRLQTEAARATELAQANDLRAGLLQAVSHDLRTPLASIKASITSLRQSDIRWDLDQMGEFFATIDEETDRLTDLVNALLEMSRLQAGVIAPSGPGNQSRRGRPQRSGRPRCPRPRRDPRPCRRPPDGHRRPGSARSASSPTSSTTRIRVSDDDERPPRIEAGAVAGQVLLRVIDQGPGIDPARHEDVFRPFQRLVDHGAGVGLGLAIARGFTEAMNGELSIEDTPGGGTTMVVALAQHEGDT